ncbi:MAG: hypothetical protein ACRCZD_05375 [Phycicoccus sp.]
MTAGTSGAWTTVQQAVVGGNPSQIAAFSQDVVRHATKLISLVQELDRLMNERTKIWPEGSAGAQAAATNSQAIQSFLSTIKPIISGAQAVAATGNVVQASQTGMNSAAAVDPAVSGLLSNPMTKPAGIATAISVLGTISKFLTALGGILTSLGGGAGQLGQMLTQIGTVAGGAEQLLSSLTGGSGSGAGSTTNAPATTTPATAAPTLPTSAGAVPALPASVGSTPASPTAASPYSFNPYGTNPYGTNPYGSGYTTATGPDGNPYLLHRDGTNGEMVATPYDPVTGQALAGAGLGDWEPVGGGAGSGGGAESAGVSAGGSGGGGSTGADTGSGSPSQGTGGGSPDSTSTDGGGTTEIKVTSSTGESMQFEVAATNGTTAEVQGDLDPDSAGGEFTVRVTSGSSA